MNRGTAAVLLGVEFLINDQLCLLHCVQDRHGKYRVEFEDGDSRLVHPRNMLLCNLVGVGEMVMAEVQGYGEPAIVTDHITHQDRPAYQVRWMQNNP